jgi:tetratricopeptide (TPR) repeat protein
LFFEYLAFVVIYKLISPPLSPYPSHQWKASKKAEEAPWEDVGGDSDDEGDFAKGAGKPAAAAAAVPTDPEELRRFMEQARVAEGDGGPGASKRDLPAVPVRERVVATGSAVLADRSAEAAVDAEDAEEAAELRRAAEQAARESRVRAGERAAEREVREAERRAAAAAAASAAAADGSGTGAGADDTAPSSTLPPVRGAGGREPIRVSFTKAVKDVPVREGKAQIDPMGLRAVEAPEPGADVADTDPAWLKDRADNFFRTGDMASAISAYGKAIERMPQGHTLYANRAACHLKAGNARACVADAGIAIGILGGVPESSGEVLDLDDARRTMLAKLLARRGGAHAALGELPNAIRDLEESLRLNPAREDVRADLATLVTTRRARQ